MSLRDNIEMVKEELNSEEKFFEKAVVTERFIKKYKKIIIISIAAIVVVVGANIAYDANERSKTSAANIAFAKLEINSNDTAALNELKSLAPNLHDAWIFSQAIANKDMEKLKSLKNTKALIINDLAEYEMATDNSMLEKYASKQDAIFRDLALIQGAIMLLNNNKIDEARNMLEKVSKESSLEKLVASLLHYGIK
ncbi:conserved hypothetical protein [Sulfurimonas denitrificans DSM 1251]|uniref:Tetratricopeptide repeat-like domain-containing protein n=1 Tax=Sulfurimonas denitrificans (strain ATCC 33889 / DSM 1251) TaxID=326298 RepID=Q30R54_SULDN|nr:hypothetical protein [Sulfurimonas denitrificans]ABB44527.1 conserved hypothetical protein [Sulfurimonas denitrificans DSM 1251]MDD3441710.1 hypothetical protein [Sulfurimonas denitrificans]